MSGLSAVMAERLTILKIVGIVGVFVGFVAAENTPAAVVFKYGGFAVEEATGSPCSATVLVTMQRSSAAANAWANLFMELAKR